MEKTLQSDRKYFDYIAVPDRETRAFLKKRAEYGKAILKRTAQGVWEMGQLLCEVKEKLPHGDFGTWIEYELGLSDDSAQNFMRVFKAFEKPNFSVFEFAPSVLYELAKPSVSDETRAVALEAAQAGNLKTVADAKTLIASQESVRLAIEVGKFVHLFHTCGTRREHPDAAKLPQYSEDDLIAVFQVTPSRRKALYAWENFYEIYARHEWLQQDWSEASTAARGDFPMTENRRAFETRQLHELCAEAWGLAPQEELWPRFQSLVRQMHEASA